MNPITLPVAELKPALTGLGKIINRRSTLPVLGCVLVLRDQEGWVTLSGTDLDSTASVRLEQPGEGEPATALIPFPELQQTVKACGAKEVITVEPGEENRVTLRYPIGNQFAENSVESFPLEEFPTVPKINGESIRLENGVRNSLLEAMQCASTDETRYVLNGAFIDVSESGHYIVATDGRHLYSSNSFTLPINESVIVPSHRFLSWKPFADDGEWNFTVITPKKGDAAQLRFQSRRWSFICRAVEGNYPNYRQVVPDQSAFKTTVQLAPEAVDPVLKMLPKLPGHDRESKPVGLVVRDGNLTLRGIATGGVPTDLGVEARASGAPVTVWLNREYLAKALRFGLTEARLCDPMSPLLFADSGRRMVVMPIRVQEEAPETGSEPDARAPQTQTERSNMPRTQNGNGHTASDDKPALELSLEQAETAKESLRGAVTSVTALITSLRQAQRDQRSSEKEIQGVRTTLEKLQSVRI